MEINAIAPVAGPGTRGVVSTVLGWATTQLTLLHAPR